MKNKKGEDVGYREVLVIIIAIVLITLLVVGMEVF